MMRRFLLLFAFLAATQVATADEVQLKPYRECDPATRAVVDRVVTAFGGEQRIDGLFNLHIDARDVVQSSEGEQVVDVDAIVFFPDSVRAKVRSAAGDVTLVVSPDSSYILVPGAIGGAAVKLDDDGRDTLLRNIYADPLVVLRRRRDAAVTFGLEAPVRAGKSTLDVLRIDVGDQQLRWYIDPTTGRIVRTAVGEVEVDLGDWRSVSGFQLPFSGVAWSGERRKIGMVNYRSVEANLSLDKSILFKVPTLWLTQMDFPEPGQQKRQSRGYTIPSSSGRSPGRVYLPSYSSRVYVDRVWVDRVW